MHWYPEIWAAGLYFLCEIGYWFSCFIDLPGRDLTKHRSRNSEELYTFFFFFFKSPCLHGEISVLNHRARQTEGLASNTFAGHKSGPALGGKNTHYTFPKEKRIGTGLAVEWLSDETPGWGANGGAELWTVAILFDKKLVFSVTCVQVGGIRMRSYSVNHSFSSVRIFVTLSQWALRCLGTLATGILQNANVEDI